MASVILQGLEIHFYLPETHQIIHLSGTFTAEELCVEAAKKLGKFFCYCTRLTLYYDRKTKQNDCCLIITGISPLCSSLFALYDEFSRVWYPPNYSFNIDETTRLKLFYRMRYSCSEAFRIYFSFPVWYSSVSHRILLDYSGGLDLGPSRIVK